MRKRWMILCDPDPDGLGGGGGGSGVADPSPLDSGAAGNVGGGSPGGERPDFNTPNASEPGDLAGAPPASTPADPNQRVAGTQPAVNPAAPSQWQSIRDAAQAAGFQFGSEITDDRQALNFLLQRAQASRQQNHYEQLGRQLAPKAGDILGYLQGKQPAAQAAPTRKPWEAPEFDERWSGLVDRDPATGLYVSKQGVPPTIADKVNEFVDWKTKYDRNPASVLNAMVEAKAQEIAKATFTEQFAEQQRQVNIQRIVADNNQWMYQKGADGQYSRTFDGQPVLTPHGARYVHHLRQVVQMGVADPVQQDALAKELVRGEITNAYYQQQYAANNADPQTAAAQTRPNVNPLQAQPPVQRRRNPAATEPAATGLSLSEMLARDLQAEGVTNEDIARSVSS